MRILLVCILMVLSLDAMNTTPRYQHKRIEMLKKEAAEEKVIITKNGYEDPKKHAEEHAKYVSKTQLPPSPKNK